jgi:glyoxylase-like metal-dependent hydrolase (beta-lactamase superfamily II)
VAPQAGEECVVVDPGVGVESRLGEVLAQHRLRPAAVLLTHGHVDHVYAVTPVCDATASRVDPRDDAYRLPTRSRRSTRARRHVRAAVRHAGGVA